VCVLVREKLSLFNHEVMCASVIYFFRLPNALTAILICPLTHAHTIDTVLINIEFTVTTAIALTTSVLFILLAI
jgi:hypothetical protein